MPRWTFEPPSRGWLVDELDWIEVVDVVQVGLVSLFQLTSDLVRAPAN